MGTGDNTPTPMLMKRMSMAAASSAGQFIKWNHICTNLIQFVYMGFHSMTVLIIELIPPMHVDVGMIIRLDYYID